MNLDERRICNFFDSTLARQLLDKLIVNGDCYPLQVVLHLTTSCNHRCRYCNFFHTLGSKQDRVQMISDSDAISYLREFEQCGVQEIVISGGGDPLLHKDIHRVLSAALEGQFRKHIYSNLDLNLDDETFNLLANFDTVNLNINTMNSEVYQATRGRKADLQRALRNVDMLIGKGATVNAIFVVRDDASGAIDETVEALSTRGFSTIVVTPAFDLEYTDGVSVKHVSEEMLRSKEKGIGFGAIRWVKPVEGAIHIDGKTFCRSHYFDITIGADYKIYPCCTRAYATGYELVDLRNYPSFVAAWGSSERRLRLPNLSFSCKTCWFGPVNDFLTRADVR